MCLAVPVKVLKTEDETAQVEINGVTMNVSTALMDGVEVGNWVLVHAGYIIEIISEENAQDKLELWDEYYKITGKNAE
ncbi:MAG: HypC/HybG/HupF family hydrogenase formation chaperone [Deltaproteobacteria bacterium]|nr:HypC/HybG/HupF family hydrogenase formation chaperone [Deltaproteobacteria bacterium]